MLVIATKPGRSVRRASNGVQKYAIVQSSGKFKFTTDVNAATQFRSTSDLLFAIGARAQELDNAPTHDLTIAEVETSGVRVKKIQNGA